MPRADPTLRLEYVREPAVSEALNRELIELISGCFTQPQDAFLRERRYAQEMPLHRYLLRSAEGRLIAHLAVHEKVLRVAGADVKVGGLAEVCVRDSERGHGHVRRLLDHAHQALRELGIPFAFLFGDSKIYHSSGYRPIPDTIACFDPVTARVIVAHDPSALVRPLTERPWPEGPVDLRGPLF
jgi:predicted N-acetyltransferase YhbS